MHEHIPFAVMLPAIFIWILLNRNDVKELRAELRAEIGTVRGEIGLFRTEVNGRLTKIQDDLNTFHRSLGQHDKAIEILEKKR